MKTKEIKLKVRHEIGISGHPFCGDYMYTFTDRELEDYISLLIAERMPTEEEMQKECMNLKYVGGSSYFVFLLTCDWIGKRMKNEQ